MKCLKCNREMGEKNMLKGQDCNSNAMIKCLLCGEFYPYGDGKLKAYSCEFCKQYFFVEKIPKGELCEDHRK